MYNNQKFADTWDDIQTFNLNFDINGFGRTYYNRQLEVFRCAWTDELDVIQISPINKKLAGTLSFLDPNDFKRTEFRKEDLREYFEGFGIDQIAHNSAEQEILSKLLFGFFSEKGCSWDIDDEEFAAYVQGNGDLAFIDRLTEEPSPEYYTIRQQNLRRRNTLLLFLKIIDEASPPMGEMRRYLWDAVYFNQDHETKDEISFGRLDQIRHCWEQHQLRVYFVFALEKLLEHIHLIVIENAGIPKNRLIDSQNVRGILSYISDWLHLPVDEETTLAEVIDRTGELNGTGVKSSLHSPINESDLYNRLRTQEHDEFFADFVVMLSLLFRRYSHTPPLNSHLSSDDDSNPDLINMETLFAHIEANGSDIHIISFLSHVSRLIVNRHMLESVSRFAYGTKNWLFTEEEGRLYSTRDPVHMTPRDNRWQSIRTLLQDLAFIEQTDEGNLRVTKKGLEWLEKIQ
ncbi:hypothetical protein [Methanofollis fontis]|uniref:Uncharacterized protein n=1 Tax=Methanofollis fontis TaxID=2052832 RepID=A0A483CTM2_9EURY|nr:hypothetical protein [Methanofollis fontis]TAJ44054.1 hypothetical protein CUJ86_08440 [Methanofollis fontis]